MKQKIIPTAIMALGLTICAQAYAADTAKLPQALSSGDLATLSGGASPSGVAITKQTLTAVNSGNSLSADNITTGDISVGAGAFNGFNGVGNFVFNTGNNNNVQGSLSVTIMTPAN
jgi:hypothetical protein